MPRGFQRAPAPLFSELEENEEERLALPEQMALQLGHLLAVQKRLTDFLAAAPAGTAKGIMLDRVHWSAEKLLDQLTISRRAGIAASWQKPMPPEFLIPLSGKPSAAALEWLRKRRAARAGASS